MPGLINDDAGSLWAQQPAAAALDYTLSYDEAVETSIWTASPALSFSGQGIAGGTVVARISGGVPGRWHMVTNVATLASGATDARSFRLFVAKAEVLPGAGDPPTMWGVALDAVMNLRRDKLIAVARDYMPDLDLSDAAVWKKLREAEAEAERRLGVWLHPREVIPASTPPAEKAYLAMSGEHVVEEPGYDYDPRDYAGDAWGAIQLRHGHVSTVRSVRYAWPDPLSTIYTVPLAWVRLEGRAGRVQFVPAGTDAVGVPLNSFLLGSIGAGRAVPFMLQIAYRAGLEDVARDHPDIVSATQRLAILSILDDGFLSPGGSVSADGLSQSFQVDLEKHREALEHKFQTLSDSLRGIRFAAF